MANEKPKPIAAAIFYGGVLVVLIEGATYAVIVITASRARSFDDLMPLVHGIYSTTLIGTVWYMLGRFFASLRYWRPTERPADLGHLILHASVNFAVVSFACAFAGFVYGLAMMNGGSRQAWEVPMLAVGLVIGHVGWNWADSRADHILRHIGPLFRLQSGADETRLD